MFALARPGMVRCTALFFSWIFGLCFGAGAVVCESLLRICCGRLESVWSLGHQLTVGRHGQP